MAVSNIYDGSSWVPFQWKFHDGAAFVLPQAKFWDGSSWVSINGVLITITVGSDDEFGGTSGWSSIAPVFGSVSPASPSYAGQDILSVVASPENADDLSIVIDGGSLTKSFFTSLTVEDGTGATRVYTSASATFSDLGTRCFWRWGSGTNPVWGLADSSEQHTARLT